MKSTDLLNPGDFHQVTHQIRELVAYAISQLETAEQDGSLPSGKFARFLFDAAVKCPGYDGPGETLPGNQHIVEDGNLLTLDRAKVRANVVDGVLSLSFVETTDAILQDGMQVFCSAGANSITRLTTLNVVNNSPMSAKLARTDTAFVTEGTELPMHDQGGHSGVITAKVSEGAVTDMVFTTGGAHIIRDGAALNCLNRAGASGKFEIAPDKSVGYRLNADYGVHAAEDTVHAFALTLGAVSGISTDNRVSVLIAPTTAMSRTNSSYDLRNAGGNRGFPGAKIIRTATGYTDYIRLPSICSVLMSGDTFATDDNAVYEVTIMDGRITKLTGVA